MQEIKIYVGLNDSESLDQKFDSSVYISLLKNICFAYRVPFSFNMVEGGYFHENGEYTQENTLVLTLIDVDGEVAEEIAKDLCAFFHQESVLMTASDLKAVFIQEKLTVD
ncbi:MAG: hypothetical protein IJM62_03330 [Lachnospiraceae bacterium]|nr:hypothetical protein [Lachnospiraceae bacterium]